MLDYGDSIYAPTINDLAICLSYALMNNNNIYLSLKNIISEYHKIFPINEEEINNTEPVYDNAEIVEDVSSPKKYSENDLINTFIEGWSGKGKCLSGVTITLLTTPFDILLYRSYCTQSFSN